MPDTVTFSCPACGVADQLQELLRVVEANPVHLHLDQDGEIRSTLDLERNPEVRSGELVGYRCGACEADFPEPARSEIPPTP